MRNFYCLLALLSLATEVQAQCVPVFTEHFDSDSAWTRTGGGNVTIQGGQATWNNEQNGHYDFYNASLPSELNNSSFRAEFKFTVGNNSPGEGVGAQIFALCAGPLDFRNYDGSMGYAYTPQDGLGVLLTSVSTTDDDRNDWVLQIDEKDGDQLYANSGDINLSSTVDTYYAVFERTSPTSLTLSVYLDAGHTQLFGTATKTIHDSVIGLNTVQFGNHTAGNFSRHFTGTLDDILICQRSSEACTPIFSEPFDSASSWIRTGTGDVTIQGGQATWDNEQSGHYDFYNASLPSDLSNSGFHAEFKFTVGDNSPGEGAGAQIFAVCAGPLDFRNYDGSMGYAYTPQDGLGVLLTSVSTTDDDRNDWVLQIDEKDGDQLYANSGDINLSSTVDTYYAVFERTSPTSLTLSVYLDADHTQLFGTATKTIHDSVIGLNTVQFGNHTAGNFSRHFTGTLDDIVICQNEVAGISSIPISPKPELHILTSEDHSTIILSGAHKGQLDIFDALGRHVASSMLQAGSPIDLAFLPGCYIARWRNADTQVVVRFVQP